MGWAAASLDHTLYRIKLWDRSGCADGTHRSDVPLHDDTDHEHSECTIQADLVGRDANGDQQS